MSGRVYRFGEFELHAKRRELTASGESVRLGGRAFELLDMLLAAAGDVVSKAALYSGIWPGMHVEETNLRVHVSAIRKALGDGQNGRRYIKTVSGRGYAFVADVVIFDDDDARPEGAIQSRCTDAASLR